MIKMLILELFFFFLQLAFVKTNLFFLGESKFIIVNMNETVKRNTTHPGKFRGQTHIITNFLKA